MASVDPDEATVQAFISAHQNGGTLEEISALFGCTRERIRQIEARAIAKISRELRWRMIYRVQDVAPDSVDQRSSVWDTIY